MALHIEQSHIILIYYLL